MIALREYQETAVAIDPQDLAWLAEHTGKQFTIRRALNGQIVINPAQFIGVMNLPSGTSLTVRPKVPASNLFIMLATAYRLPSPFRDEAAKYDTIDEILEFLID